MKSVYIHIPFCINICSYCDFCKFYYYKPWISKYLNELEKEIKKKYHHEKVKTLYIGGGTPSSLDIEELTRLFQIIQELDLSDELEFTVECNIESITEEKLKLFYKNKVNRLSIGVQTIHPNYLSFLERKHTKEEVIKKIKVAKKIGFQNINIDLMYGFPNETLEDLKEDLKFIISLDIPHISCYSLMIEPHTKIYGKVNPIDEEIDEKMYLYIKDTLLKHGFIHYETSNYAKSGFESKHNLTYWENEEYYGFGLGASGYVDNIRYENTTNLKKYLNGKYLKESHLVDVKEQMQNEFILGFRKSDGINKEKFKHKYDKDIKSISIVNDLLYKRYLKEDDKNIFINEKYRYVANEVLVYFIDMEV